MNRHLRAARRRLVLAYVGVFAVALAAFAVFVSWTLTRSLQEQLDGSLRAVVQAVAQAVPDGPNPTAPERLQRALGALRFPDRDIYAIGATGMVMFPEVAPAWVRDAAIVALENGSLLETFEFGDHDYRVYAETQRQPSGGQPWVVVAAADFVEVEDRYPAVFGGLGAAALGALLLVALGGAILARRSISEAETAFDQLRRFTADAAHELRTPVSVIQAQAEVALGRPRSSEELSEALAGILGEASRLAGTVEKLLLLARADAGEWPSQLQDLYLDDQLSDLARSIRSLAGLHGVEVEIKISEECPVRGDTSLLQQLIMILTDNAVQFTPPGASVHVAAVRQGGASCLVVTDQGPGIPTELLPHVFDRFFRGDPARSGGGAGLGLSIARWIADIHGAVITLEPGAAGGTVARVTFPSGPTPR